MIKSNPNIQLTKSQKDITIFCFAVAILLLVAQEWADVGINSILFVSMLSIPLWILPKKIFLRYVFFSIPLCFGMHGFYCLLIYLSLLVRCGVSNRMQIVFPALLVIIETINCLNSQISFEFTKILIYLSFLGVWFYVLLIKCVDSSLLLKYFCYGIAFGLLLLYGRVLLHESWEYLLIMSSRAIFDSKELGGSDNINHFIANANTIAYFSIALLSTIVCTWKYMKLHWVELIILSTVAIMAGLLSFSRTWILCAMLIIILYFIMSNIKEKLALIIVSIGLFFCLVITNSELVDSFFSGFESRFSEEGLDTGGQRTIIFDNYNKFFLSHPEYWLWGTGTNCYHEVCHNRHSIHNGLQQVYICTGLFGILLFSAFALYLKRKYIRTETLVQWIPFIIILLFDQSIQLLSPIFLIFPFIMGVYSLRLQSNDTER